MEDLELLDEFVKSRSQSAFSELVSRHLPVVYSAARRMVRDSHLAEEVAQSAFATLAQKADSIRPPQVLGGWLYNTTRHLAMHAVRTEQRRREREQIACAMQSLDQPANVPEITEHLEPAMAELDAEDRDALVLRFLANRGLREVGAELGISEEAARKRVTRALDRLRAVLEQRAFVTTEVLLVSALASTAIAVPIGLAAKITSTALIPGAVAAATKATVVTLKAKILATTAAVTIASVGTAFYFLRQPDAIPAPAPPTAAPVTNAPIKLANSSFVPAGGYIETVAAMGQRFGSALLTLGSALRNDDRFVNDLAADVRRTTNSSPAGHIRCLLDPTSSGTADYLASINASNANSRPLQACKFIHYPVATNSPLFGKRIRVSGWLKTSDVQVMAAATLVIVNESGHIFADDPMNDRPLRGTRDWTEIEIVADVPSEPCTIYFGPVLYGGGELWADDFQISIAPPDKSITDDRKWHVWSPNPGDYSVTTDYENEHDGHPTICISYTREGVAPPGSWMWWGQCIREPDQYRGHTVRMTVWMKSENISDAVYPNLRPKGAFFNLLAKYKREKGKTTRGTTDWTKQTFVCDVPDGTQCLDTGFAVRGSGKVWIDMDALKYDIIDRPKR